MIDQAANEYPIIFQGNTFTANSGLVFNNGIEIVKRGGTTGWYCGGIRFEGNHFQNLIGCLRSGIVGAIDLKCVWEMGKYSYFESLDQYVHSGEEVVEFRETSEIWVSYGGYSVDMSSLVLTGNTFTENYSSKALLSFSSFPSIKLS